MSRRVQHVQVSEDFNLQRFVEAQDARGTYTAALRELQHGYKQGHWMWFIFPQITGLGRSQTAQRFAISGVPEAAAYLAHPVLGPRLVECAHALTGLDVTDAVAVFGSIDAQKLQSSMTLFAQAGPYESVFCDVLDQFFLGAPDEGTVIRM